MNCSKRDRPVPLRAIAVRDGTVRNVLPPGWIAQKRGMSDATDVGVVPALAAWLFLSQAPTGSTQMREALEEQASLPTSAPRYPRAEGPLREPRDPRAQARELVNERALEAVGQLKAAEHTDGTPQGKADAAAASAQGQARANQVRKNPIKPPKPDGPHP